MSFQSVLSKYRKLSFSERDKGDRFERLMQAYLKTEPNYAAKFKHVWLWKEFFGKADFGGKDTGIDLVAQTYEGDYWAIQCKCFAEGTTIDKPAVDTFLSTSGRTFKGEDLKTINFAQRLWISTTNNWGPNATAAIQNQVPPVTRINLTDLQQAPVDWEKLEQGIHGEAARSARKTLLPHQEDALAATKEFFQTNSRGKLIMACGTGKTFTSLRIAEEVTGRKGLVLFLVPSIALLAQSLREWSADAVNPIHAICICSDAEVSRQQKKNEDTDTMSVVDLALPASTNAAAIKRSLLLSEERSEKGLTVIFSTYQSVGRVAEVQKELRATNPALASFDLIVCDEAHRTSGYAANEAEASAFTLVHDNESLRAARRLYMTATPKLFSDAAKSKAAQADAPLWSMDDPKFFGEEIFRIGFGEAVEKGLLSDYKVLVLALNEADMPIALQTAIAQDNEIRTDTVSKLAGCINALSKKLVGDDAKLAEIDPEPMRRAVAFSPSIEESKKLTAALQEVLTRYIPGLPEDKRVGLVSPVAVHVDGTMSATDRDQKLQWLKSAPAEDGECRILTNVRCLSEGVDVPSLDAVIFISPRNSEVEVVQSVGRVMRRAPGKKYGYIIIPVVVPAGVEPDKALDDNERFRVVWTVLNALRAHDDRFNAMVNKIDLNQKRPDNVLVVGVDLNTPASGERGNSASGPGYTPDGGGKMNPVEEDGTVTYSNAAAAARVVEKQLQFQFQQLQNALFAKMVLKVGDRRYWEQWAKDVSLIAERQVARINRIINEEGAHKIAFEDFLRGLQRNINPGITQQQAVEMLAQHVITKPVFEALFEDYSFAKDNPISVSMQKMLDLLEESAVEADTETLQKFYDSVRKRAEGIDNAEAKQRIIVELYDKFFKTAFPKMVEQLGIVYTPVEVVDFIVHSVADVLESEFGRSISDENIHILDPFTGTGTFITRLLQSGRILPKDLHRKYTSEIHANEIVLLAYYIAAVNIENAFHDVLAEALDAKVPYEPFKKILLTDTFQMGEGDGKGELYPGHFAENYEGVVNQMKAPLTVIIGNPPYSIGQKSANDNAQNESYPKLDARIAATYAKASTAGLSKSLYDAYIKAFRWGTDRLDENGGVICFVSNGAWLDGNSQDGFRKHLEQEFSSIYVFNLRGNQRTSGELSRKEGGKVFGSGSRTGIAITLLVKNPTKQQEKATIHYHDIGDYHSREEKLAILRKQQEAGFATMPWKFLTPNEHGDWLSQRNDAFDTFIPLAPEKKFDPKTQSFFTVQGPGILSNRDAWVYNFSQQEVETNMRMMITFYNQQAEEYKRLKEREWQTVVEEFINTDASQISWTRALKNELSKGSSFEFYRNNVTVGAYRPFCKQHLYFNRTFIESPGLSSRYFPEKDSFNRVISIPGTGSTKDFSIALTATVADYQVQFNNQCFPLYYYEPREKAVASLFDANPETEYVRRDGISDFILQRAQKQYGKTVGKEDIFYYVYGVLHSPQYRTAFAADLKKMLPRLPLVEEPRDFWKFSKAGRELAELHINYERVNTYKDVTVSGDDSEHYRVEKMRFPKKGEKDSIVYNSRITVSNIPVKAYDYVVNGKSAIEWIMERYQITTHKESGITNDPNDWADEVGNPRYILDLLLSVINVSVQTVEIVAGLPELKFEQANEGGAERRTIEFIPKVCDEPERTLLSVHIINTCNKDDFGRVKFQKLLHLVEYHCKKDLSSKLVQHAAGPHDGALLKAVEFDLKRFRLYDVKQENSAKRRVTYTPIQGSHEQLEKNFKKEFQDAGAVDEFLMKLSEKSMAQCEIISTLYAVWNNRIIQKESITDELLKQDFLAWDKQKVKYKNQIQTELDWMRTEAIIPEGWGRLIEREASA